MKTLKHTLIIALTAMTIFLFHPFENKAVAQTGYYENNYNDGISFGVFYQTLAPYGRWVNHREYGYVWIPNVERDFRPYVTHGYWVMTDYGNTWVSDFEWGWAPFHYGRWYYDDIYGWTWIPGYEWAPAWVVWRHGGGFYGWAPLGPHIQVSVHIQLPSFYWVFLPAKYLYHPHLHRYYKPHTPAIYNRTTIINHIHIHNNQKYYTGPAPHEYQRETGYKVKIHQVTNSSRPGRSTVSNRTVSLYRPEISRSSVADKNTPTRSTLSEKTGRSTVNRTKTTGNITNEKTTTISPERSNSQETTNRNSGNAISERSISKTRSSRPVETINRSVTPTNKKSVRNANTSKNSRQSNNAPVQTRSVGRNSPSRSESVSRSSSSTTKSASNARSATPSRSNSGRDSQSSRSSK